MATTVAGTFPDRASAERAIGQLQAAGFSRDDIGVIMQDKTEAAGLAEDTGTHVAADAATGAVTGGVVGGVGAAVLGLGSLFIPGIGPFLAGGILAAALGGALTGGIIGALVGLGFSEPEAEYYDQEIRGGRVLVTVRTDEARAPQARTILQGAGAGFYQTGASTTARTTTAATTGAPAMRTTAESGQTVQLREEELRANKQRTQAGEVVIGKDVVTEKKTIEVPVKHEEVFVERRPVEGRPAAGGEIRATEQEIHVPVMEEQVRVEKVPVVKEEIRVGKREVTETERVSGTVRKEVADIDRKGDVNMGGAGTFRSWNEVLPQYRASWQSRYGSQGGRWEDYEPGYRYGYEMSYDSRYQGKQWGDVESDLRSGYSGWAGRSGYKAEPNAWERFKMHVREAWDSARGHGSTSRTDYQQPTV